MKSLALAATAGSLLLGLAGCGGKDALSAHTDTVAKAGAEELSVKTLADLAGQSKVPLKKDVLKVVADLWIDYQLLARAAASGDSLFDAKLLDQALWAPYVNIKAQKWYQQVSKTWPVTVSPTEAQTRYDAGEVLVARHILLAVRPNAAPIERAAIQQRADSLRRVVNAGNFAQLAGQFSTDPGSAKQGGQLPPWPSKKNVMVPEFENGVLATKPGQISGLVASQFGFHIIYRPTYAEVAQQVAPVVQQLAQQRAESTYFDNLEKSSDVKVKADAPKMVRDIVADADAFKDNKMVLATMKGGDFTAAHMVRWIGAYPQENNLPSQIANAPDTVIPNLVRNFVRNELFLRQADSAKIALTAEEMGNFRKELSDFVASSWGTLGVAPAMLPDSIKKATPEVRQRFVAQRINTFVANMLTKDGLFVQMPRPLEQLLRLKYPDVKVYDSGLDAALEAATKIRTSADSARNAKAPPSAVPGLPGQPGAGNGIPGMPGQGAAPMAPGAGAPQGGAPQGGTPPRP
ncbi:MAG: peptidylprolyl isomerase [Gemmatimonadaceae bacterium]|nr:peptidylprolyl isomerase [Gemmatimonadaceae bacterium]